VRAGSVRLGSRQEFLPIMAYQDVLVEPAQCCHRVEEAPKGTVGYRSAECQHHTARIGKTK